MKKILVVEDDNILQKAIETALSGAKMEVITAFDGNEAIKKAKIVKPDLIILDLLLPKKDGWEVLKEIKKDKTVKNIPVLVLTVFEGEEGVAECIALGAKAYLIKSRYTLDEIIEKVEELLKK